MVRKIILLCVVALISAGCDSTKDSSVSIKLEAKGSSSKASLITYKIGGSVTENAVTIEQPSLPWTKSGELDCDSESGSLGLVSLAAFAEVEGTQKHTVTIKIFADGKEVRQDSGFSTSLSWGCFER